MINLNKSGADIPLHATHLGEDVVALKSSQSLGRASLSSTLINLLKTILGAGNINSVAMFCIFTSEIGIIVLPAAINAFGYIPGLFLLILASLASFFGLYLFIFAAAKYGHGATPFAVASITYPSTAVILDIAILVKCFGVCISYLLLTGSIMSSFTRGLLDDPSSVPFLVDDRFWVAIFMIIIIPLSFLTKMDHLKYSSFLGLAAFIYVSILSVVNLISHGLAPASEIEAFSSIEFKNLGRFGVFVFAFTCHQNIFPLMNETKKNSVANMTAVSALSVFFSLGLYTVYGLCSYLAYAHVVSEHKNMFAICNSL